LDLLELVDFHSFCHVGVEDILLGDIVAFLPDFLLGADDLVFNLQSAEAEFAELFREIVRRNFHHSKEGRFLCFRDGREVQLSGNQVVVFALNVLVKDDLVHGFGKININLVQESCCVS